VLAKPRFVAEDHYLKILQDPFCTPETPQIL